jgi:hypothetical protein
MAAILKKTNLPVNVVPFTGRKTSTASKVREVSYADLRTEKHFPYQLRPCGERARRLAEDIINSFA